MLKFKPTQPDTKIVFSSDSHYGHDKPWVIDDRNFRSKEEHCDYLLAKFSELPEDYLLVLLGDIFLTCTEEKALEFFSNIKCQIIMCWGNHNAFIKNWYDESLPEGFGDKVIYPLELKKFPNVTMMGDVFVLTISKRERYWCSHYAFMTWDKMHMGELPPQLFGHSHGSLKGAQPNENSIGKLLDVGVDNAIKWGENPWFTLDNVRQIMQSKETVQKDHH